jgi:hypothetical protein
MAIGDRRSQGKHEMAPVEAIARRGGVAALWGEASSLGGVLACVLAYGAGTLIRYQFVEPEVLGAACERTQPWWCPIRTGFIIFTQWKGFGWLALLLAISAAVALVRGRRAWSHRMGFAAMIVAGFGMILYNATMSVPAAILALICLIRAPLTERTV